MACCFIRYRPCDGVIQFLALVVMGRFWDIRACLQYSVAAVCLPPCVSPDGVGTGGRTNDSGERGLRQTTFSRRAHDQHHHLCAVCSDTGAAAVRGLRCAGPRICTDKNGWQPAGFGWCWLLFAYLGT